METRSLDEIRKECEGCRKCSLAETRTNVVFGVGNPNADVMFIGEAPGEKEDLSGIPFVGAAGKLFDKYLVAVGIPREEIYIANMLKCRPPKNRDPKPEEQDLCIEYLREQVRAVSPKLIVCLGRIAAMRLIKPDFRITAEHGIWFERGSFSVCAVYQPSALLRDPRKKDDMLADMIEIKRRLDALKQTSATE